MKPEGQETAGSDLPILLQICLKTMKNTTKSLNQVSHKYLPNLEYDAGGTKQLSSTMQEILSSSTILVTPGISSSKPNMLPNVILAFST